MIHSILIPADDLIIQLGITFHYHPGEPASQFSPGDPESIELHSLFISFPDGELPNIPIPLPSLPDGAESAIESMIWERLPTALRHTEDEAMASLHDPEQ